MAQKFKEVAHLRTDMEKYSEGYDRIFGKKNVDEPKKEEVVIDQDAEYQRVINIARQTYKDLEWSGQESEGFPHSPSFIYGFMKGYDAAKEGK